MDQSIDNAIHRRQSDSKLTKSELNPYQDSSQLSLLEKFNKKLVVYSRVSTLNDTNYFKSTLRLTGFQNTDLKNKSIVIFDN